MASAIFHRWTCDRCDATDEGEGHAYQPSTWVAMVQVCPPAEADLAAQTRRVLCANCHASYIDWWNAGVEER